MSDIHRLDLSMPDRDPWTLRFGPRSVNDARELVVLAPPGTPPEAAFRRLEGLAARSARTGRVIGHGVTMPEHRPAWIERVTSPVLLTELDVYLPCERTSLVTEAEQQLRDWVADVLAGATDDLPVEQAFWGSAMVRVFSPWFASFPLARGLAHHHAAHDIVCLDGTWHGTLALEQLMKRAGGTLAIERGSRRASFWAARVVGQVAANAAAATLLRAREFVHEARSRQRMRELREQSDGTPDVWLGLQGEWPRTCRHVVEGIGAAARERGSRVGVLLHATLRPGCAEAQGGGDPTAVFPAMDHPILQGRVSAVEQCAAVETVAELARNLVATSRVSARVAARLVARGPSMTLGPLPIDLGSDVGGLARLATIDVLRAREAAMATRRLLARRDFRGARVVWPHASVANVVVPDLMMQAAGAVTYDLVHGALAEPMDFVTHARTHSSCTIWWSDAEVDYVGRYLPGASAVGGYVPRAVSRRESMRDATGPLRILVVSNYATPIIGFGGAFAFECYQDALIDAARQAALELRMPVTLKWRPHPYDDPARVQATLARCTGALKPDLSTSRDGLQDELAWADVVVSSISSSIVETLLHPVALFVHDIPRHERDVLMPLFEASRRFANAEELTSRLAAFARSLQSSPTEAFAPEDRLRERFFGRSRRPRDLAALLWQSETGPAVGERREERS